MYVGLTAVPVFATLQLTGAAVSAIRESGALIAPAELASFAVARGSIAPLCAGVLAVLAVGSEYRHRTLLTTLLVTPRRGIVFEGIRVR